jgi:hypothetical protein
MTLEYQSIIRITHVRRSQDVEKPRPDEWDVTLQRAGGYLVFGHKTAEKAFGRAIKLLESETGATIELVEVSP